MPARAHTQGDLAVVRLLLRAHAKLLQLTAAGVGGEHRAPRDPRRIPDGYGKTAYTVAFDLGRRVRARPSTPLQTPCPASAAQKALHGVWCPL